jgi:hypothetical protein
VIVSSQAPLNTLLSSLFSSFHQLVMNEMQLETILVIGCVSLLLKTLQEITKSLAKPMESSINLDMVGGETFNNLDFVVVVLHNYCISIVMNKLV